MKLISADFPIYTCTHTHIHIHIYMFTYECVLYIYIYYCISLLMPALGRRPSKLVVSRDVSVERGLQSVGRGVLEGGGDGSSERVLLRLSYRRQELRIAHVGPVSFYLKLPSFGTASFRLHGLTGMTVH